MVSLSLQRRRFGNKTDSFGSLFHVNNGKALFALRFLEKNLLQDIFLFYWDTVVYKN